MLFKVKLIITIRSSMSWTKRSDSSFKTKTAYRKKIFVLAVVYCMLISSHFIILIVALKMIFKQYL